MALRENVLMMSEITPKPGDDHDVDRRVAVKPEEVLEQNRITAERRVEDADVQDALRNQQKQGCDAEHRVARI